jgi:CBS domain-containing protein
MQVRDVMTANVISVSAQATILEAARTMLRNRISGLPVVDAEGRLLGMVTEGDFLRRSEIGTERRRPKWLEFVLGPGRMAEEYVHVAGRKIEDVMTRDPVVVGEDDDLQTMVELMERRRIKRLPVLRNGKIVGIVSRANLMRALVSLARTEEAPAGGDPALRERIVAAFAAQPWAPHVNIVVKDSIAELRGTITDERERQACIVTAENVAACAPCTTISPGSSRFPAWRFRRRRMNRPGCRRQFTRDRPEDRLTARAPLHSRGHSVLT